MQRGQYNCDKIKAASKKKTNDIFIRYKTTILDGAIKIINKFMKDNRDGVHYKNLCEELLKYVRAQKKCVREEVLKEGKSLNAREWNKIVDALYTTFNSQKIKRLCYLEKDNDETKKKDVLNIHEVFRNFCIEKKPKETKSSLSFEECNEYLSWINGKKMYLQGIDPGYKYIEKYKEYFNIRNKCNYPWLISIIPDVTCTQFTRTKPTEKDSPSKSLADTDQTTTVVTHSNSPGGKNDTPAAVQPFSEGDGSPPSAKVPDSPQDKSPTQSKNGAGSDLNSHQDTFNIELEGTPVAESTPIFELRTIPQPAHDPKYLQFKNLFESDNYLRGKVIPHKYSYSTNIESSKHPKIFTSYVEGEPIKTNISKPYKFIPPELLHSQEFLQLLRSQRIVELLRLQQFRNLLFSKKFLSNLFRKERFTPPIIHSQQVMPAVPQRKFDVPKPKPIKTQVAFIPAELIIDP
ncbi:STP1 protein, partial [Plasmodium ovale]